MLVFPMQLISAQAAAAAVAGGFVADAVVAGGHIVTNCIGRRKRAPQPSPKGSSLRQSAADFERRLLLLGFRADLAMRRSIGHVVFIKQPQVVPERLKGDESRAILRTINEHAKAQRRPRAAFFLSRYSRPAVQLQEEQKKQIERRERFASRVMSSARARRTNREL